MNWPKVHPCADISKIITLFVLMGVSGLVIAKPAQAEIIRSFTADIVLNKDCSLYVTEGIKMDFGGHSRNGIFRAIPLKYSRYGNTYSVYFKLLSVTDYSDKPLKYSCTQQGRDISIRIGDPNMEVTGIQTYKIRYLVRRCINFIHGAPEVYWNVTGNEWPFAMQTVTARFYPPPEVDVKAIRTACYAGAFGESFPGTIESGQYPIVYHADGLPPSEGLTIVAGLPRGSVTPPSMLDEFTWLFLDWWPAIFLPILSSGTLLYMWISSHRYDQNDQPIAVEWDPPVGLTPAEVGTIVDGSCDMQDIVSTLVDLAARGYLQIKELHAQEFLFFSSKDYEFHKQTPPVNVKPLLAHEQEFLRGIFAGDKNVVTLSSLREKFYTHLPTIRKGIYGSLMAKKFFAGDPQFICNAYKWFGIVLMIVGMLNLFSVNAHNSFAWGCGITLSGLITFIVSGQMPARTALGAKIMRECLGFQRFLKLAEKQRIEVMAKKDPTLFGRLIPYAMVLGASDQWARAFQNLLQEPPNWYVPYGYGTVSDYRFSSRGFIHDLGYSMNTMGQTFASSPSATAGSGGSGFSGGFSGGGFGGGGGGSW